MLSESDVLRARPAKNKVDPYIPYAFFVEQERTSAGTIEDVATIFLVNRECPFKCIYCDLWKNTTDTRIPVGAILSQIDYALTFLPKTKHVKLYNSGNFFDPQAIPPEDHAAIVDRLAPFETVIVENHPRLTGRACLEFRDRLNTGTRLEIALGLETSHDETLARMQKQMTPDDFRRAAIFLRQQDIDVRTFILLKPPYTTEAEGVERAMQSITFAFDAGATCCAVIPTRAGNGIMEQLEQQAEFSPPRLTSLETVLEAGIALRRGRVFADVWDIKQLSACPTCAAQRIARLHQMNLEQRVAPPIDCNACTR